MLVNNYIILDWSLLTKLFIERRDNSTKCSKEEISSNKYGRPRLKMDNLIKFNDTMCRIVNN